MKTTATLSAFSLCVLSATEIAYLVRSKQVSPTEVVREHAKRIQRLNPALNAFAHLNLERAFAEAKRVESLLMSGSTEGTLLGVPITIKSCIDVEGLHCAAGSQLRANYVALEDATLVSRLRHAGDERR